MGLLCFKWCLLLNMFFNLFFCKCFAFSLHHGFDSWSWASGNSTTNTFSFKKLLEKLFSTILVHKLLQLNLLQRFWFKNLCWLLLSNMFWNDFNLLFLIWNNNNLWHWCYCQNNGTNVYKFFIKCFSLIIANMYIVKLNRYIIMI